MVLPPWVPIVKCIKTRRERKQEEEKRNEGHNIVVYSFMNVFFLLSSLEREFAQENRAVSCNHCAVCLWNAVLRFHMYYYSLLLNINDDSISYPSW
jgi:hypothetical protein